MPRSRTGAPARWGSRPVLSGRRSRLMPGALQDYVAQPGFVFLTERRQDHGLGQLRANEALAFERRPDRRAAQAGRIARRDDRLAEMEMIAMRIGQLGDREPAGVLLGGGVAGQARQFPDAG